MTGVQSVRNMIRFSSSIFLFGLAVALAGEPALAQGPVVRAVLFFAPTCPHCHKVINQDLPGIFNRFGGQPRVYFDTTVARSQVAFYDVSNGRVEILLVDASKQAGANVFMEATERFHIPSNGVPRLIVGDSVLIGSLDIPMELPKLIEKGLAGDGIDWPDISTLRTALASIPGVLLAAAEPDSAAGGEVAGEVAQEASPGAGEAAAVPAANEPQAESPEQAAPEAAADTQSLAGGEEMPAETAAAVAGDSVPEGGAAPEAAPTVSRPVAENRGPEAEPVAVPGAEGAAEEPSPAESGVGSEAAADSALGMIPVYKPTMMELYRHDPVGNSASVVVLVGMVLSLAFVGLMVRKPTAEGPLTALIPLIAVVGIGVAAYLTYIESSGVTAVCGPVGDCNTVNQSEYARLFGVIPVAALGLASYVAIILAWSVARVGSGARADWAKFAILALCAVGTVFSIYLTFLEPFVIGATCAWCLTSAVAITALMLLSARPGLEAWARIRTR
jgi:uncharacterized membrane protein